MSSPVTTKVKHYLPHCHNFPMHTTNIKHSWQNGTRCRNSVKLLWCHSHIVWLVFEGSIPCFHSENFFVTLKYAHTLPIGHASPVSALARFNHWVAGWLGSRPFASSRVRVPPWVTVFYFSTIYFSLFLSFSLTLKAKVRSGACLKTELVLRACHTLPIWHASLVSTSAGSLAAQP